ncbi:hypothetical protein E2C01_083969 [Portunus trituberculatus]|uniref:Uncharacterized protein n=1 Tax=Portunus trituberculatus TaxID=210409 RepID=A0A5B7IU28_PORTR|nr:hypothetical protein [Portunus trituberculatus]
MPKPYLEVVSCALAGWNTISGVGGGGSGTPHDARLPASTPLHPRLVSTMLRLQNIEYPRHVIVGDPYLYQHFRILPHYECRTTLHAGATRMELPRAPLLPSPPVSPPLVPIYRSSDKARYERLIGSAFRAHFKTPQTLLSLFHSHSGTEHTCVRHAHLVIAS